MECNSPVTSLRPVTPGLILAEFQDSSIRLVGGLAAAILIVKTRHLYYELQHQMQETLHANARGCRHESVAHVASAARMSATRTPTQ